MNIKAVILVSFLLSVASLWAKNPLNYYATKAEESWSMGRYEDALDYARQEIIDYDKNPNGYYQAARSLYGLEQPGQALSMLNKALERVKKDKLLGGECYLAKSDLLQQMGDTVQALKTLDEGLKFDGKNINLLIERARLLIGTDNKAVRKDLQKVKKLAPDDSRGFLQTAVLYIDEDNYKDALEEMTRAIALDNSMAYSYGMRGFILKQLGSSPDWIADCLRSYDLDSTSPLGIGLLAETEDAESQEQIIREIERKRTPSNGFYKLEADLLYAWGKYALAGAAYEEMIKLGLADEATYYYLGDCQQELGFIIDAYVTATKGSDLYPDNLALKFMKVQIGVEAGKGGEVLDILNSLIAQSPETEELYFEKGKAYLSLGRYADAVEPLATAVMLNPSALNKIYYADALRLSGNVTKAVSEYNDILHMSPTSIAEEGQKPQYLYAMAYSGLGNRADAVAAIKSLAKEEQTSENEYLPAIYARLGLTSDAINMLREWANDNEWSAFLDLYTYNFHILHHEPAFAQLLAEHGVNTQYNAESKLLEYVPENIFATSGGTSMEEAMELLSEHPQDWVTAINQLCPIDMGTTGQLESVDFDAKTQTAIFNYVMGPSMLDFDLVNSNQSYKRKKEDMIILTLVSRNPKIANLNGSIKYNIKSPDGSQHSSFLLTPAHIKEVSRKAQSQDEVDQMLLDFWIEEESLAMAKDPTPYQGTVTLDGNTITYTYIVPENDGSMARIELFQSDVKKQFLNFFKDPMMIVRLPVFVRQNKTLKFTYKGIDSGKTIDIEFTPEELAKHIK